MLLSELYRDVLSDLLTDEAGDTRPREVLAMAQRAARIVTAELAQRSSWLVAKTAESGGAAWPATLIGGRISLPGDFMASSDIHVAGRLTHGPLGLINPADRFQQFDATPGHYYLEQDYLVILPAPADGSLIYLGYLAWPEVVLTPIPPTDDETLQLMGSLRLPFRGLFDETIRQFTALSLANRAEYDTAVEQGLYRMLSKAAHDVASKESVAPQIRDIDYPVHGMDWTGRGVV